MPLPHYYSSLKPFRVMFQKGAPVLAYHHVGPRLRGVRLKGLFLSPRLFLRQMTELRQGGFSSAFLDTVVSPVSSAPRVFLTFDDGFQDVFEHALPIMQQCGFRSIVFLVSDLIGKTNEWQQRVGDVPVPLMDEPQIRDWLAAGHQIGSHTRSHPRLTHLPAGQAREELLASKKSLEDRFGVPIEHFCYPYGDWDESVRNLVPAAGYKTACTTESGVNTSTTLPYELRRFTARYQSRNLKALWARIWQRNVEG